LQVIFLKCISTVRALRDLTVVSIKETVEPSFTVSEIFYPYFTAAWTVTHIAVHHHRLLSFMGVAFSLGGNIDEQALGV
jgi:hypothetical protein